MKIVTLTRDMRPFHAGSQRILPDAIADQMVAAGDAENPQEFTGGPPEIQPGIIEKVAEKVRETLRLPTTYKTKDRRGIT